MNVQMTNKKPSLNIPSHFNYGVVILNRYPELAEKLIQSIRDTHKELPPIVVVRDRNDATFGDDVKVVDGVASFVFARNSNLGIQYFASKDIFLCNDDIEMVEKDTFPILHAIATTYPKCGMLSPLVKGGLGNDVQNYHKKDEIWKDRPQEMAVTVTLHFPCILLRRRMIHRIGLLDENFTGYGFEDLDYGIRAIRAGFWTMVTQQLYVKHGNGEPGFAKGKNYSLSFAKEPLNTLSMDYFNKKYGQQFELTDQRGMSHASK